MGTHCIYSAYSLFVENFSRLDDTAPAAYYIVYYYCISLRDIHMELFVYSHLTRYSMTGLFQNNDIYIEKPGKLLCPIGSTCIGRHRNWITQFHLGGVVCKEWN